MKSEKTCPFCGETIKASAIKCRWCGSMLTANAGIPPVTDQISLVRFALAAKYEIIDEIGSGGMSIVYKAKQKSLNRLVAIKTIRQTLVHDEEFVMRFHQEAQVAASLDHPNIIKIFDEGVEQGVHFMVMEYLEGQDLFEIIQKEAPLKTAQITDLFVPLAQALGYLHLHGLVHRDIKSSNIYITITGRPVLMDFGIAHEARNNALTQPGTVIGTPEFMSPEQAMGKTVDGRSDLYSLGVVMYQCVTGTVPFRADNPITIIHSINTEKPQPVRELNRYVPDWLESIIIKLLEKQPADRIQTGEQLAEYLRNKILLISAPPDKDEKVKTPPQSEPKVRPKKPSAPKINKRQKNRNTGGFNTKLERFIKNDTFLKAAIGLVGICIVAIILIAVFNKSEVTGKEEKAIDSAVQARRVSDVDSLEDLYSPGETDNIEPVHGSIPAKIENIAPASGNYDNQRNSDNSGTFDYDETINRADGHFISGRYALAKAIYQEALFAINKPDMDIDQKDEKMQYLLNMITQCDTNMEGTENEDNPPY